MDAHSEFLGFIEQLEALRKDKKLTPNVCVGQEGATNSTAKGGAGAPSIAITTQAPDTTKAEAAETNTSTSTKS